MAMKCNNCGEFYNQELPECDVCSYGKEKMNKLKIEKRFWDLIVSEDKTWEVRKTSKTINTNELVKMYDVKTQELLGWVKLEKEADYDMVEVSKFNDDTFEYAMLDILCMDDDTFNFIIDNYNKEKITIYKIKNWGKDEM